MKPREMKSLMRDIVPGAATMGAMDSDTRYELTRVRLADGLETTVYLARHPRATTSVRVVCFREPRRLDGWCAEHGR